MLFYQSVRKGGGDAALKIDENNLLLVKFSDEKGGGGCSAPLPSESDNELSRVWDTGPVFSPTDTSKTRYITVSKGECTASLHSVRLIALALGTTHVFTSCRRYFSLRLKKVIVLVGALPGHAQTRNQPPF